MSRKCGNCSKELEVIDQDKNIYYCPGCNETFAVREGKITVSKDKSKLDEMDIFKTRAERNLKKINKALFGNEEAGEDSIEENPFGF